MPRLPGNPNVMSIVYAVAIIVIAYVVLAALSGNRGGPFGKRGVNEQAQQMGGLQWGP